MASRHGLKFAKEKSEYNKQKKNDTHTHIQVHLKKIEYHEKGQYFLSLISESETHILYRLITQSEIFQVFISRNVDDYGLQIMKTQNSVSQKI